MPSFPTVRTSHTSATSDTQPKITIERRLSARTASLYFPNTKAYFRWTHDRASDPDTGEKSADSSGWGGLNYCGGRVSFKYDSENYVNIGGDVAVGFHYDCCPA